MHSSPRPVIMERQERLRIWATSNRAQTKMNLTQHKKCSLVTSHTHTDTKRKLDGGLGACKERNSHAQDQS